MDKVEFISEREQFEINYRADVPMGDEFKKSVADVIIFPRFRKFLGGMGEKLNNSSDESHNNHENLN